MHLLGGLLVLSCFAATVFGAPRVIGGHDAPEHAYPYQVSLQSGGLHFCGGSILNKRWVLTAAVYFNGHHPNDFEIVVGTNHLKDRLYVYSVESTVVHEKYVDASDFNIALLKTSKDIEFNAYVQPIRLPDHDITDYSATAVFSGWGVIDKYDLDPPNDLQEIFLNLYKNDDETESSKRHVYTLNKDGEGICFEDMGGPLALNGTQIGIASLVYPCATGSPDDYTRVYYYKSWIESKIHI